MRFTVLIHQLVKEVVGFSVQLAPKRLVTMRRLQRVPAELRAHRVHCVPSDEHRQAEWDEHA